MFKRWIILSIFVFLCPPLWAITCYFTLAKDNCWLHYDVSVEVVDAESNKVLTTVDVPAGQSWKRQTFPCRTDGQKLTYRARFSPSFWQSEQGKVYSAINYWFLPNKVKPGDSAWNLSVCYPSDFSEIPFPPDASGNCRCDFSKIPVIKPQRVQ